jgi:hypothetical protein
MRRVSRFLLVVGAAALLASPVMAQPRGGPFGMGRGLPSWMLVSQKSVQEELKLTGEQVKKAEELSEQLREKQRDLRESLQDLEPAEARKKMQEINQANDKAVAAILKPEQVKRVHQISRQLAGAQAFNNPEIASELKLTDNQKQEIQKINEETGEQMRDLFQGGPPDDETRKKMEDLRKIAYNKAVSTLTSEQKDKWKEMTGKPFTGQVNFFGRRGRGG